MNQFDFFDTDNGKRYTLAHGIAYRHIENWSLDFKPGTRQRHEAALKQLKEWNLLLLQQGQLNQKNLECELFLSMLPTTNQQDEIINSALLELLRMVPDTDLKEEEEKKH
jgi:hypothetical protein